jgi:2-octaprenyl-6-methoxyphenol hydroxylase
MDGGEEVVIVGGGLVGCSLALALARDGRRVRLAESRAAALPPPGFDERNLALAAASLGALQRLGVLSRLPRPPAPIRHIHVSRCGDFGAVRLAAAAHGVDAFGGVVMARDLGAALLAAIAAEPRVQRVAPATVVELQHEDGRWRVGLDAEGGRVAWTAALLVAADGADSGVRRQLGIAAQRHDYGQTLVVCSVAAPQAARDTAWERFSASGPVALLPRNDGRLGAVCGVAAEAADGVLAADDEAYRRYLQERFGWRAGAFTAVGRRVGYPLLQVVAERLTGPRAVLVGNAAQALHPIGAQGFNLGLRDALGLAELLRGAADPGAAALLDAYAERRREDRAATLAFSDGLARLTSRDGPLPHLLRSLGLLALARSSGLRQPLVHAAMGLRGMPPRWLEDAA